MVYVAVLLVLVVLYGALVSSDYKADGELMIALGVSIIIWPIVSPVYTAFLIGYYLMERKKK